MVREDWKQFWSYLKKGAGVESVPEEELPLERQDWPDFLMNRVESARALDVELPFSEYTASPTSTVEISTDTSDSDKGRSKPGEEVEEQQQQPFYYGDFHNHKKLRQAKSGEVCVLNKVRLTLETDFESGGASSGWRDLSKQWNYNIVLQH